MSGLLAHLGAYAVRVPLDQPLLLSHQTIVARDYIIVEAADADGIVGRAVGYSRGAPVEIVVERMLTPYWVGAALDDYTRLYDATVRDNIMQGTHGMFWRAISLADCAVHDLLAQRAGVPLSTYLGGAPGPVPVTLAGCYPTKIDTPDGIARLMDMANELPVRGVKVTGSGDPNRDTVRLTLCRSNLNDKIPLIIDLYNSFEKAADVLPHARHWAELNMAWVEDPFGLDDLIETAQLAEALPYPVGVGDEQAGIEHFRNLINYTSIGVVRLDATTCGGVTGFRRIADIVRQQGLAVSCHIFHHLHAQLAILYPGMLIEYIPPWTAVDAIDRLIMDQVQWCPQGLMSSSAAGLGQIWDDDALQFYRAARENDL